MRTRGEFNDASYVRLANNVAINFSTKLKANKMLLSLVFLRNLNKKIIIQSKMLKYKLKLRKLNSTHLQIKSFILKQKFHSEKFSQGFSKETP